MSRLPGFLERLPSTEDRSYIQASINSEGLIVSGRTHALWWPCRDIQATPNIVLIFIPGRLVQ
jgi:hypothetical protein